MRFWAAGTRRRATSGSLQRTLFSYKSRKRLPFLHAGGAISAFAAATDRNLLLGTFTVRLASGLFAWTGHKFVHLAAPREEKRSLLLLLLPQPRGGRGGGRKVFRPSEWTHGEEPPPPLLQFFPLMGTLLTHTKNTQRVKSGGGSLPFRSLPAFFRPPPRAHYLLRLTTDSFPAAAAAASSRLDPRSKKERERGEGKKEEGEGLLACSKRGKGKRGRERQLL